ncbi:MAG: hypothetical protein ACRCS3_08575 [Paracoccaceae bacterium]
MIILAAAVAGLTFVIHTFFGGPIVVGPLLANDHLPKASKWLNYFCWHIATVLLAATTIALVWVASSKSVEVKYFGLSFFGMLASTLCVLSAAVALRGKIHPLKFPSTTLFLVLACLCFAALLQL